MLHMMATAMLVALVIGYMTYVGLRLHATYVLRTELSLLEAKVDRNAIDAQTIHRHTEGRLDDIERLLFGDVLNSIQKPASRPSKPSAVELWQRNRDRELRARLDALERMRLRVEGRIDSLEREIRKKTP